MKLLCKYVVFLLLFLQVLPSTASPISDKTLEDIIRQEKYVTALHLTTAAFNRMSANSSDSFSYYLYQTSRCLYNLRSLQALERLFSISDTYAKDLQPYYLSKINYNKLRYLKERATTQNLDAIIQKAITSCPFPDIQNDYTILLASYFLSVNKVSEADALYRKVYNSKYSDGVQKGAAANGIGACFSYLSNYDSSKIYYYKAIDFFSNSLHKQHTRVAQVKFNLALIANTYGEFYTSEKILSEVLAIYRKVLGDQHVRTAETYGALGSVYRLQDNYEKALYYSIKERDILTSLYGNKYPELAYSYLTLANIYSQTNDFTRAEEEAKAGINVLTEERKRGNNTYIQLVIKLSESLVFKKHYEEAAALLKNLFTNNNIDTEYRADVLTQLGVIYLEQSHYDLARENFIKADKIYYAVYGEKNIFSVDINMYLSNSYLQQGMIAEALKYARIAHQKTIDNGTILFPYDQWVCRLQEMKCLKELLKKQPTNKTQIIIHIENIKGILADAKRIKQTYYSNGSQLQYAQKMAELNQLGIYFLTHFYSSKTDVYFIDNLLLFAENNKANLLRYKISNDAAYDLLPKKKVEQSKVIINKLNYFINLNEEQQEVPFNINDSVLWYQDKYERFAKTIEKEFPKVYRVKYGEKPLSVKQIQHLLAKDFSFLEYCNDGENYFCLSVSKNNVTYKQCGNKKYLESLIAQFQQSITDKKANTLIGNLLYQRLLPQHKAYNLILSPDENIYHVAFDALSKDSAAQYLVYEHTTQYAFSNSTYFHHTPTTNNKNVIAFFPDFKQTTYAELSQQKEHNALKSFQNYSVFYNEKALKSKFVQMIQNAGIVHLATHLLVDTVSPMYSYLVFQPNQDYKLTINDIWKLNANAQLITLASCQSNFGKQQNGEGIQNFAWAFHYSGINNILTTQWNASDQATATIISDFYKNLKARKSKQAALQSAKINYLKNTDAIGVQPFYWANFQLYGDSSAIQISPHFLVQYWYIPILVFLFLYLSINYFRAYLKKNYKNIG